MPRDKTHPPGRKSLAAAALNQVWTRTATGSSGDAMHWSALAVVRWSASASGFQARSTTTHRLVSACIRSSTAMPSASSMLLICRNYSDHSG
jgi:hypothetical protein